MWDNWSYYYYHNYRRDYYSYSYKYLIEHLHKYDKYKGYIYLIECQGTTRFKIGKTSNIERRVKELKYQSPYPLLLKDYFLSINANIDEKIFHRELSFCRVHNEWFDCQIKLDQELSPINESLEYLLYRLGFYSQNERLARVIFKTYQKEIVHEFLKCDNNYYYKIISSSDNYEKDKVQQKYQDELRLLYCNFVISFKVLILASIEQQNKLDRMIDFIKNDLPYYIVNLPSADLELHTFKDVLSDKIMKQARLYRES